MNDVILSPPVNGQAPISSPSRHETPKSSRLVAFGRESSGETISVTVCDQFYQQFTARLLAADVMGGLPRFQRALLRDAGIRFINPAFECGRGRGGKWERLVLDLLRGGNGRTQSRRKKRRRPGRRQRLAAKARGR